MQQMSQVSLLSGSNPMRNNQPKTADSQLKSNELWQALSDAESQMLRAGVTKIRPLADSLVVSRSQSKSPEVEGKIRGTLLLS